MIARGFVAVSNVNDGEDGVAISSSKVEYCIGSSPTESPGRFLQDGNAYLLDENGNYLTDGEWTTTMPSVPDGYYLWSRTTTLLSNGDESVMYSVAKNVGTISTQREQFYLSNSSTSLTGGSWSYTEPSEVPDGKYLWGRLELKLTDGTVRYSDAIYRSIIGGVINKTDNVERKITMKVWETDIENKINAYDQTPTGSMKDRVSSIEIDLDGIHTTVGDIEATDGSIIKNLSNVTQTANKINWVVASGTSSSNMTLTDSACDLVAKYINLNGKVTFNGLASGVSNYLQTTTITYGASSSPTTQPTAWYTDPNDFHVQWQEGRYIWTKTVITPAEGASKTDIVCVTGHKGDPGDPGEPGQPGRPGADGRGVSSIVKYYKVSATKPQDKPPGNGWSIDQPAYVSGRYYWTCDYITYTSGSPSTTEVVQEKAIDRAMVASNIIDSWKTTENGTTVIDGSYIKTGSIVANRIATGKLMSTGFSKSQSSHFSTTGSYFDLDNGDIITKWFSVYNGTAAYIGPWTVTSTSIYKGNANWGQSGDGNMYFGNSGLSINNTFKVNSVGKLTATDADITGKITASSGQIGSWIVDAAGYLKNSNESIFLSPDGKAAVMQNYNVSAIAKIGDYFRIDTTGILHCENASINNIYVRVKNPVVPISGQAVWTNYNVKAFWIETYNSGLSQRINVGRSDGVHFRIEDSSIDVYNGNTSWFSLNGLNATVGTMNTTVTGLSTYKTSITNGTGTISASSINAASKYQIGGSDFATADGTDFLLKGNIKYSPTTGTTYSLSTTCSRTNTLYDTYYGKAARKVTVEKNTAFDLTSAKLYLVMFWHNSAATQRGLYLFKGGQTTPLAIKEASGISITLTSSTFKWNVTSGSNTPNCEILY